MLGVKVTETQKDFQQVTDMDITEDILEGNSVEKSIDSIETVDTCTVVDQDYLAQELRHALEHDITNTTDITDTTDTITDMYDDLCKDKCVSEENSSTTLEQLDDFDDNFESIEQPLNISWACKQQKGYKFAKNKTPLPLHPFIEDAYFPHKDTPLEECVSIYDVRLFMVADGHAGHQAPLFFLKGLAIELMQLLNSKQWDFSMAQDQDTLRKNITRIYLQLDSEYTIIKTTEYKYWVANGSDPKQKPMDDGCTMVVNLLQKNWLLNCNVGDSRSVMASYVPHRNDWQLAFASQDHNMMHPGKVFDIHSNGGKFLDETGTMMLNVRVCEPQEREYAYYSK
jgi:hypothetical protein